MNSNNPTSQLQQNEEEPIESDSNPLISLKIHQKIKLTQSQNGLRHNDYHRYRQYCSRRLRRIRRAIKFTHGKGRAFMKREIKADIVKNFHYILIPLLNAERAWAFAMQLKQECSDNFSSRVSAHSRRKLAKAALWAAKLEEVCTAVGDAITALEATAYCSWLQGSLLLEKEQWEDALTKFLAALEIYTQLSEVGSLEEQDLFSARAEEVEPNVRFCRYNLSGGAAGGFDLGPNLRAGDDRILSGVLKDKLDALVREGRKETAKALHEIKWLDHLVPLRSEVLKLAIVKADQLLHDLDKVQPAANQDKESEDVVMEGTVGQDFDDDGDKDDTKHLSCLEAFDEALRVANQESSALAQMASGAKVDEQRTELGLIQAYLQHGKWKQLNRRNDAVARRLCHQWMHPATGMEQHRTARDRTVRPQEAVHVYDVLLQGVRATLKLAGVEEHDAMNTALTIREKKLRAFRCYFLAEAYGGDSKWAEMQALLEHSSCMASEASSEAAQACKEGLLSETDARKVQEECDECTALSACARVRCQADAILANEGMFASQLSSSFEDMSLDKDERKQKKKVVPLLDRLSYFAPLDSEENFLVAEIPPVPSLVPVKPLLLDIAFNQLKFPDLDEKCGIKKTKQEQSSRQEKQGWVSWLTGR